MSTQSQKRLFLANRGRLAVIWLGIAVLGRLIPHLPNLTPMTSLSLFAGSKLPRLQAILLLLFSLFISDVVLAYLNGYPVVSWWTCFTYSGFIGMAMASSRWLRGENVTRRLPALILGSSLGFWLWTNFGVWLTTTWFPKSVTGLIICYTAALPFLRTEIIGDVVWGVIIFGGFLFVQKFTNFVSKKTSPCQFE